VANVYVYSGAVGAANGSSWADAYTTFTAAIAGSSAGDRYFVAGDHAESTAGAVTLTFKGTNAAPDQILCVDRAGSVPPVSADLLTTATVTTTGASALTIAGSHYCYGVTFACGSGATNAALTIANGAANNQVYDSCELQKNGTTANASAIAFGVVGSSPSSVLLVNTGLQFGATGDGMALSQTEFRWKNTPTAIRGATLPTTLSNVVTRAGRAVFEGVDLSALGSGKTLVGASITAPWLYLFKDCKLGASVTVAATPTSPGAAETNLIRCDSGDTNYRHERYRYEGTQTVETTIVRTGGASDGTTPISWKIITTANSERTQPFECLPISIWNETVGSPITLTVQGIWGGGAVPTSAEIWMDVEYLGTSGFPLGSFASSGPADQLASGTNLGAGSGTWGGSTTKFKLEKQITPAEKGPITVYINAAAASSTFYIDPKITVS
jgi:hypothetical protein